MFDSTTHWSEHARNVASVLCNGILAARAHRREQQRAAKAETEVPPHWRVRPPADPAPASTPAAPPPDEPKRPVQAEQRERLPIEPLTLPPPVAPWDMPKPHSKSCSHCAGVSRSAARPSSSPTSSATFSPTPPASSPARPSKDAPSGPMPDPPSQASSAGAPSSLEGQLGLNLDAKPANEQDLAGITEVIDSAVSALGEVVGDSVSDAIKAPLHRMEERRAEDQERLVLRLEAALERQTAKLCEALERQAEHIAAAIARQAEIQAERLGTTIGAVLTEHASTASTEASESRRTAVLDGLQEVLRTGFADVRVALDSNHAELMDTVRTELRPSARAARFEPPPLPTRSMVASASCPKKATDEPAVAPLRAPPLLGSGTFPQGPRIHVVARHRPTGNGPAPERAPSGHVHGWTPDGTSHAPYAAQEAGP